MRLKLVFGATLACVTMATAALADNKIGWYIAGDVGRHSPSDATLDITDATVTSSSSSSSSASSSSSSSAQPNAGRDITPTAGSAAAAGLSDERYDLKTRDGAAAFFRAGYSFTPNWRVEGELGYRPSSTDNGFYSATYKGATITDTGPGIGTGFADQTSLMLNLIYDILPNSKIHPFVGAGVGGVKINSEYAGAVTTSDSLVAQSFTATSSKTVGAWQLLAGGTWALSDHLNLDVTYRYLNAGDIDYTVDIARNYRNAANTLRVTEAETRHLKGKFDDQSLSVGLRISFGEPRSKPPVTRPGTPMASTPTPATSGTTVPGTTNTPVTPTPSMPVAPEPAVAPARQFSVYFPFDSAMLTEDGQTVVNEAADYARAMTAPKVTVVGYTDTSGSAAYNIILSKKRAQTVASGLAVKGVRSDIVKVDWKGETDLAIPTANGVKEAQNRRTTIDVQP